MQGQIIKESNCGQYEKSDCLVKVAPSEFLKIEINSKVQKLFGKTIEKSVREVLKDRNLQNICVIVNDYGALDWVIRARLECALKRAV